MPADQWIAAQNRLGINKMIRSAKYDCGILKGVLRCRCGARMDVRTYQKNGHIFSYYCCTDMMRQGKGKCNTGYIRTEQVEEAFLRQLRRIRFNPDGFKLRPDAGSIHSVSSIREELKQAGAAIDNLTAALMGATDSPAAAYIVSKIEELDKKKKALETELRKAELRNASIRTIQETERFIYQNICYLLDNFDSIEYTGKNELIRKIIKKCVLEGENLHIIF